MKKIITIIILLLNILNVLNQNHPELHCVSYLNKGFDYRNGGFVRSNKKLFKTTPGM
jgi:hypothetical protein